MLKIGCVLVVQCWAVEGSGSKIALGFFGSIDCDKCDNKSEFVYKLILVLFIHKTKSCFRRDGVKIGMKISAKTGQTATMYSMHVPLLSVNF